MDSAQQQIVERLKEATNVLVTTSSNPTVDQLAAVIGLTLLLNKADKHATAVFSGEVPSTLEFLQPEKTLEKNTDSLRDFIISLDKSKADKLRYKVEDSHVKIFITPYRTSISDKDLEFSQGDFNVDLVILLGVHEQKDLDQAITSHGRILHDATVSSIANTPGNNLGAVNWVDTTASSLCEMLVNLIEKVKPDGLDGQISTALMTGIVAETARFSNEKTTATTMATSARLMATGANQQLVATELQPKPEPVAPAPAPEPPPPAAPLAASLPPASQTTEDGALKVEHTEEKSAAPMPAPTAAPAAPELPEPEEQEEEKLEQIHIDEDGGLHPIAEMKEQEEPKAESTEPREATTEVNNTLLTTPPMLGGTLAAGTEPTTEESTDPLSLPPIGGRLLSHDGPLGGATTEATDKPVEEPQPSRTEDAHGRVTIQPPAHDEHEENVFNALEAEIEAGKEDEKAGGNGSQGSSLTLGQIEQQITTQTSEAPAPPHVSEDQAREAVSDAVAGTPPPLTPPAAFNSQPLDMDVQGRNDVEPSSTGFPPNLVPPMPTPPADNTASSVINPMAPPPLPPPMMPPMPGFTQPSTTDQPSGGVINPQEPPK